MPCESTRIEIVPWSVQPQNVSSDKTVYAALTTDPRGPYYNVKPIAGGKYEG